MWNYEKTTAVPDQYHNTKCQNCTDHRSPSMADQTVKWEHPCVTFSQRYSMPDRRVCGVLTDIERRIQRI